MTESSVPTNSMGTSSSVQGSGPIDTFDPIMKVGRKKTLDAVLKRPLPKLRATKRDGDHGLGKRL